LPLHVVQVQLPTFSYIMSASFLLATRGRTEDALITTTNPLLRPTADPAASHAAIVVELNDIFGAQSSSDGRQKRSWRCMVAPSTQAEAGDGVFVRNGKCPAGRVVAAYPGVSYEAEDLTVMHKLVLPGNSYVMFRRDGVLIDGRPDGPSQQMWEMAERRERAAGKPALDRDDRANELAIGNMVNHPPRGTQPNVVVHPIDLAPDEQLHLHQRLPVVNFRPPAEGEPCKRTVVLISAREIAEDEELYLDYKLRADGPRESWYVPVSYPEVSGSSSARAPATPEPAAAAAAAPPGLAATAPPRAAAPAAAPVVTSSSNIGRTPPNRFSGTSGSFHSARGGNL
jgi:hypothetical protein